MTALLELFDQLDHSVRINLLLLHLRSGRWLAAPKNVGLKTGLTTEEMGLAEATTV